MYYLKSFRSFVSVIFFPAFLFAHSSQFNLEKLKKNYSSHERKINTVVVHKKDRSINSFLKSGKDAIGLSFVFERVVPRSWKKILGFRRHSFVSFLTVVTALVNGALCGYCAMRMCPSVVVRIKALCSSFTNQPAQSLKPPLVVDPISKPSEPDLHIINPEPVQSMDKPIEQKPGEFD
jgi:hypothetical protein